MGGARKLWASNGHRQRCCSQGSRRREKKAGCGGIGSAYFLASRGRTAAEAAGGAAWRAADATAGSGQRALHCTALHCGGQRLKGGPGWASTAAPHGLRLVRAHSDLAGAQNSRQQLQYRSSIGRQRRAYTVLPRPPRAPTAALQWRPTIDMDVSHLSDGRWAACGQGQRGPAW